MGPQTSDERSARDLRLFLKKKDLEWLESELMRLDVSTLAKLRAMDLDRLQDSLSACGLDISQRELESLSPHSISEFLTTMTSEFKSRVREAQRDDGYILFLSHYKVEAGTEAALMRTELEQLLAEGEHSQEGGVFLDSEDLTTLTDLQDAVRKSKNVAVLLTANVLTRPWVLVELATAHSEDINVLPVELNKKGNGFVFPEEDFFDALVDGSLLGEAGIRIIEDAGFHMHEVVVAVKHVLKRIALPYSPHRPATIRRAEVSALIHQCVMHDNKTQRGSKAKDAGILVRAKRLQKSDSWVANLLTKG